MAATDFETLRQDICELRTLRDRLTAALSESITRLRTCGASPSSDVLDIASRYRRQYWETRQQLSHERGAALAGPTDSLEEWEQAMRLAQRQQQATDLLDDAEAWQVRGVDGPGPLSKVRDDVANLRHRLCDDPDQALNDLFDGRHPLAAVQTLIQHGENLPDDEWTELLDRVSVGYGRELATAISRGKVLIRAANPLSDAAATAALDRKSEVPS